MRTRRQGMGAVRTAATARGAALGAALVSALAGCEPRTAGPASGSGPVTAAGSATVKAKGDPAAARRLYDEAVLVHLAGDELGWQERLVRLAAEHPDTPHGRAAARRLSGAGQGMMITGVMAAVAIPAFMKYIRRSKTSEATMNLRRMFDGAVVFYSSERVDAQGNALPRRFPQSTGLAPAEPFPCAGGAAKYPARTETWAAPGFAELGFSIDEPHYYRYEFISTGEGTASAFTARAIGDLNCDGVFSTFERVGHIDEQGNVNGGAGLFTQNELE